MVIYKYYKKRSVRQGEVVKLKIALEDDYFIERKLFPNVDFYSGIILKAIGIPTSLFTVIFAIGRTPGWIAHWHEMLSEPYRIGRPRQLYKGHTKRDYPG